MQWLNLHPGIQEQDMRTTAELLWKHENLNQNSKRSCTPLRKELGLENIHFLLPIHRILKYDTQKIDLPTFQAYPDLCNEFIFLWTSKYNMGNLHHIRRLYFSFALSIHINSHVKDAGRMRPDLGIYPSLHRKLLNSCNRNQQHTKNSDPFFLFKQNKVMNTSQIFPWPLHPVPPAEQH